MLSHVTAATIHGLEAIPVETEVDINRGLFVFLYCWPPDKLRFRGKNTGTERAYKLWLRLSSWAGDRKPCAGIPP